METNIAPSVDTVLDKGSVRRIQSMGGDLMVLASARVSNGLELEEASKGDKSDKGLIKYLINHRHGTPFEHSVFTFYVKAPLFVAREWFRHRMSSYNEISGRYVTFETPEFYVPKEMRIPGTTNKQGSVRPDADWTIKFHDYLTLNRDDYDEQVALWLEDASDHAWAQYQGLLKMGLAKELARIILPLNFYTQWYWTVNARSLMNFLSLRNSPDAQWEIQEYARVIENLFQAEMPNTYDAWIANNRVAP